MRLLTLSLLFFLSLNSAVYANDMRSKVKGPKINGISLSVIDPDHHVYGIYWGTTEEEFIINWGEPAGYIRFNHQITGMLYGKRHMFIFRNHSFSGVKISPSIIDWQLGERMMLEPTFDPLVWRLKNGIRLGSTLTYVKKILGNSLIEKDYVKYYETDGAKVILNFAQHNNEGDEDSFFRVHSILIVKKNNHNQAFEWTQ